MELYNFCISQNIIRVIESRKVNWERHVARMGVMRNICDVLAGKLEGKNHSEDLGEDGKIILEWILRKPGGQVWIGCI
jgi:hypothetical protein